jgi:predicted flap endonuclease-1-like 5' DNA nuclease
MQVQADEECRAEKAAGAAATEGLADQTLKDLKNSLQRSESIMNRSIEDIEGIGPVYAEMLKAAGVANTSQLLAEGGDRKGRLQLAERCGINEKLILKWVNMSDLFRIKGVAGQWGELLEASGVDTVKELCHRNPEKLADRMREINKEKRLVKQAPGVTQISSWVDQAKKLQPAVTY